MNKNLLLYHLAKYFYMPLILLFLLSFGYISFPQIIIGYFLYCIYIKTSSETHLFYTKTKKNNRIMSLSPDLAKPNFKPHFLFPFVCQQMLLCNYIRPKNFEKLRFRKDSVNEFGVTLYWAFYEDKTENLDDPILFILPGMTGHISDSYVQNLIVEGINNGYHVVVYEMRILNENFGVDEKGWFRYYDDIDMCLRHIKSNPLYKDSKIYAIGGSYGSNNLLFYLGEKNSRYAKDDKMIEAAVSISSPYDLYLCARLNEGNLAESLIVMLEQENSRKISPSIKKCKNLTDFDTDKLINIEDVKEFDEYFSARFYGFKNADDYYRGSSATIKLPYIDVPTLCISSKDDVITPSKVIPYDDIKMNENIILMVSDTGGHMCFYENDMFLEPKQWHLKPAFQFLNSVRQMSKSETRENLRENLSEINDGESNVILN